MAQHRRKFGAEQGYDSERNLIKKHEENKEIAPYKYSTYHFGGNIMRLPTSQQHSWSWAMRSISPAGSRLARVSWAFTIVVCIPATILSYSKRPFFYVGPEKRLVSVAISRPHHRPWSIYPG
jgi:hypothetical protein